MPTAAPAPVPTAAPSPAGGSTRRGSWPALLALAATFVLLFYWQRSRSTFLRIEQERPAAAELAEGAGLDVADVLALRDMIGLEATAAEWARVVAEFSNRVRQIRAANKPDNPPGRGVTGVVPLPRPVIPAAAMEIAPDDLAARRFLLLRERFHARR